MELCVPAEENVPERRSKVFDEHMMELAERLKFPDQLPDKGDYKKPYLILFNGLTSAILDMEKMNFGRAKQTLMIAQQDAEEAYLDSWEENEETNDVP